MYSKTYEVFLPEEKYGFGTHGTPKILFLFIYINNIYTIYNIFIFFIVIMAFFVFYVFLPLEIKKVGGTHEEIGYCQIRNGTDD